MVRELRPDVVGLSVMTFQRASAFRIARLVKSLRPETAVVAGGYDPSLAPDSYAASPDIDYVVRGEGERTFCELLRALENRTSVRQIAGLSVREGGRFVHNADRPIARLAADPPKLPNRRPGPNFVEPSYRRLTLAMYFSFQMNFTMP